MKVKQAEVVEMSTLVRLLAASGQASQFWPRVLWDGSS